MPHSHEITQEMRSCIQNCTDCHRICTETAAHCLQMGGKHAEPAHIRLLLDCAQICQTSSDFMLRTSHFHMDTCRLCAEVCSQCAESCARLGQDDPAMQECSAACRRCADSCRNMASVSA